MTIKEYINGIDDAQKKEKVEELYKLIKENIDSHFKDEINYNMIGFVVPKSIYPNGYHVNPDLPLPFINIGAQKNHLGLYHMGVYADPELLEWVKKTYPGKLNMGKSCIRLSYKKPLPRQWIETLIKKMTIENWISIYKNSV